MYFQKFDVENSDGNLYWHQYMQNILAAQSEGNTLRKTLNEFNAINYPYTFIIPVYENMPSSAFARPSTTSTNKGIETDLVSINVTSSIKMRNVANGSTTVGYLYSGEIATRLEIATSKVNGAYWDKILKADGTVGYVARSTGDSESTYKLYIVSLKENNQGNLGDNVTSKKGDANNDGKITASDYVLIKNSIMGMYTLSEEQKENADYNSDGKITASDYVLIKNKIMEN